MFVKEDLNKESCFVILDILNTKKNQMNYSVFSAFCE